MLQASETYSLQLPLPRYLYATCFFMARHVTLAYAAPYSYCKWPDSHSMSLGACVHAMCRLSNLQKDSGSEGGFDESDQVMRGGGEKGQAQCEPLIPCRLLGEVPEQVVTSRAWRLYDAGKRRNRSDVLQGRRRLEGNRAH